MSARNTFAATRRSHAILKRLRRGEGITIREVSDEFDIQYPQARADLKLLEELYDLDTYRDGRVKVWELPGAGDKERHIGIAAALELGGVALDVFKNTPYGERIQELIDESRRNVRKSARERLERLSKALVLRRNWSPVHEDRMFGVLEEVLDAIRLTRGVEMTYERSDGEISEYVVIPRRLIWYQGRLWLQAVDDDEEKLFDVAGVLEVEHRGPDDIVDHLVDTRKAELDVDEEKDEEEVLDELRTEVVDEVDEWFEYGSPRKEEAYFADAFGIFASNYEPREVELIVHGSWETYLRRYRIHDSQVNEETDDGLRVRFEIGICPEFKSFILGMVPEVEVVAPTELRDELVERTEDWKG